MSGADEARWVLLGIHKQLLAGLQTAESKPFVADPWERASGMSMSGDGNSCVVEGGGVYERGGVNFSDVSGAMMPPAATTRHPHLAGKPFRAIGVSLVIHPRNPFVPTSHLNVRVFTAGDVWWFGGGFDLTPWLPFEEDAIEWHHQAAAACALLGPGAYVDLKARCDKYFYLPHRDEMRGVGGIFFDDLNDLSAPLSADWTTGLAFIARVAQSYLSAYLPIVQRRHGQPFTQRERDFQLYRRGRYVEFNLVQDRGTLFGLQSKGRTDSILVSMPPLASWSYRSPDPQLDAALAPFLRPRDWLAAR